MSVDMWELGQDQKLRHVLPTDTNSDTRSTDGAGVRSSINTTKKRPETWEIRAGEEAKAEDGHVSKDRPRALGAGGCSRSRVLDPGPLARLGQAGAQAQGCSLMSTTALLNPGSGLPNPQTHIFPRVSRLPWTAGFTLHR